MTKLDNDLDALFQHPLPEFIGARKTLAARLKKDGRGSDAELVKSLTKPSISAWTVSQLYWNHRDEFEELIGAGQRFRKAQKSGKLADMRDALDARREALAELSDLATAVLRDAGNNPSLDTIRRITTTLEALSAYESFPDDLHPGRLTEDIDPPGFESFGSFVPTPAKSKRIDSSKKSTTPALRATTPSEETSRVEDSRQIRLVAAKASLQSARKSLSEARARAKALETAQRKAEAAAKEAEKNKREAEERFKKATAAATDAARRARTVTSELDEAIRTLKEAEHNVDKASKELETAFRQLPR